MHLIENQLLGKSAKPHHCEITERNPAPWKILEFRVEINPICIWLRGHNTIWFRADCCEIK